MKKRTALQCLVVITGLMTALAGCELIVKPDVGLIPTFDATCTVCLDDAETVIDIDGDVEIVPNDGGDGE